MKNRRQSIVWPHGSIPAATRHARVVRPSVGTRVKQGKFQIVDVEYAKNGISTVIPATGWMSLSETIDALYAINPAD